MLKINPPTIYPPMQDAYAQIVVAPAGRLAFLAGMVALDADSVLVGAGDYAAQARQCFENIRNALMALGTTPDRVVKMTMNVVDYKPELTDDIFGAALAVFGADWPVTASMLLGVQTLARPEWLIEVDAIASLID